MAEQLAFRCFEKEAGVESAARAEGITRSNDRQPHGQADALGRTAMSACQRLRFLNGRNVEVMWLTGRLVPDHKTIAVFRKGKVCARFIMLCCALDLSLHAARPRATR